MRRRQNEQAVQVKKPAHFVGNSLEDLRAFPDEMRDATRSLHTSGEPAAALTKTGGNNVFADIGLPNADVHLLKTEISMRIEELIGAKGLTQEQAARCMGITQPDVSEIVRGTVRGYTLDRLFNCLLAMGQVVEVSIARTATAEVPGGIVVTH